MPGIKYLLDTNFIIGLLKSSPEVAEVINSKNIRVAQCAFSSITRMELLGFASLKQSEILLIQNKLDQMTRLEISMPIEEKVIQLRRSRSIKMPDAIIAATALVHSLELLSFDQRLLNTLATCKLLP